MEKYADVSKLLALITKSKFPMGKEEHFLKKNTILTSHDIYQSFVTNY
jgi:hypothetical protein